MPEPRVRCALCKRNVKLDALGYLMKHNRPGGTKCDGSHRHKDFNAREQP